MEDVDVLVVGAGPVGLLLGTELQRDGIGVSVIDGMPSRGFFCKALGITPRTLEIFDDLGIVDRAIAAGVWLTGVETWVDGAMVPARSMHLPEQGLPYGSIEQIAYRNGFNDAAHCSRRFRDCYGVSPRAYRKREGSS
jgi:2-polyprenyl-6-methoxyphenol hydroxylase-like FAD-dependent oxidoreductase